MVGEALVRNPSIFKSRTAYRLIRALVLFSACITLVTTGIQLATDYRRDVTGIEASIIQVQVSSLATITQSLWAFDDEQLGAQLDGLLAIPDIEFVEIKRFGKGELSRGTRKSEKAISQTFPIVYRHSARDIKLGQLEIVASLNAVYQRLFDKALIVLAGNAVKTFLVSGFLFLIFYYLVSRHLTRIGDFIRNLDPEKPEVQLKLDKKGPPDELDQVSEALNGMLSRLRESEDRLRDIVETMSDWIWETGPDLRFTWLSPSVEKVLGRPAGHYIGKTREDLGIPDDDVEGWKRHLETLNEHRGYRDFQFSRTTPDGKRLHLSISEKPLFDRNGVFLGYRGTGRDITERVNAEAALHESEARLNAFFENAPVGMALYDSEYRFVKLNNTLAKMNGKSIDEHLGRNLREVLPDTLVTNVDESIDAAINFGKPSLDADVSFEMPGEPGIRHHFIVARFPVPDSEGEINSIGAVIVEVTDRKHAEDQLRQAQKMEAVGQLTGGIAHEFNNLLMVIVGNLERTEDQITDDGARNSLSSAMGGAMRAAELTNQLLAFSRKQNLKVENVDLNALVRDIREMLQRTLGETVVVDTKFADEIWPALVDKSMMESALLNLALNARDAMSRGGRITITTSNQSVDGKLFAKIPDIAPGDYVKLEVSDTGTGIAPENLEHVFEPFFTTKDVGKGTGLGLSMVLGFAKQSGGFVDIESQEGKGTSITIYLPRAAEQSNDLATEKQSKEQVLLTGSTVLVVEDDPDVRQIVMESLTELGPTIIEAKDGKTALSQIDEHPEIDVLFTDVVLPGGMSGYDIADVARRNIPTIKIILTSGYPEGEIDKSAPNDEQSWFIRKPYRKAELAELFSQVMRSDRDWTQFQVSHTTIQ